MGMKMARIVSLNGLVKYTDGLDIQKKAQQNRINGVADDTFYVLEHEPVFTVGKRVIEFSRRIKNIDVVKINRGGNITYHGPGQLVVYPIINVKGIGVKKYVGLLEEVIIRLCKKYGINAERSTLNRGVWVKNRKIASVGISVKKGISYHGIAFNVNNDLTPFSWIDPCGLKGVKVTSLERELNHKMDIGTIKETTICILKDLFGEYLEFC